MVKKIIFFIILFVIFMLTSDVKATDYIWSGSGTWSTTTNWTPNGTPGASDTVTFNNTSTSNCTIDATSTISAVTVTSGYTGLITQSADVTVNGNFYLEGAGTSTVWNVSTRTITVGGDCTILKTTTPGTMSFAGNGTLILTGNNKTLTSTGVVWNNFYRLYVAQNGNTTTIIGQPTTYSSINIGTGTLNLPAGSSISNSTGGIYTMLSGGKITGEGSVIVTTTMTLPGGDYPNNLYMQTSSTRTITLGESIVLNGTQRGLYINGTSNGIDIILDTSANSYNVTVGMITLGSTSVKTGTLNCNSSTITVSNNVSVVAGSTINAGSSTWNIGGTFSNSGTFNAGTSKVVFTGNNTLGANTFYDLTISGGTTTLSGNVTVLHDLTIGAGANLNSGAYTITVGRNITNVGTLTIPNLTLNGDITNSGTLTTGAVTISSGKTILLNSGSVWNVNSGSTITVNGTLRSSGTASSPVIIQNSSTSGYFGLTINGSADLTGCKLYYLNTDGLKFSSSGTITKIDNVDFRYGQSGGTHLQVLNGQTITITNITFDDITNGANITVKNNTKIKVEKCSLGRFKDNIEKGSSIDYGINAKIDPNIGGRIADNGDANTYIEVPKGAIKQALMFTLSKIYSEELSISSNTKDSIIVGYNIEAVDENGKAVKNLDGSITLVIHTRGDGENVLDSNNTNIGIKVAEATNRLCIGYWNERYWTKLGGKVEVSVDKRDITVRTNVSHLSRYAIVVKDTGGVLTNVSPNPFTPAASQFNTITFSFENTDSENVEIKLWDITGVLVRTITNTPTSSVVWDGRDEYGEIVEAGVYIYQLKVGNAKAGKGTIVVAK